MVGYTCFDLDLVLAKREMDGIRMLARREAMGPDDFEEGRGNGQTTAFKSSSSSEGLEMQVCVRGDENGRFKHDDDE